MSGHMPWLLLDSSSFLVTGNVNIMKRIIKMFHTWMCTLDTKNDITDTKKVFKLQYSEYSGEES